MVESDIRFYRRRAYEEMAAANRSVTMAARERRLRLVDIYVEHLRVLNAPSPFDEDELTLAAGTSAFGWPAASGNTKRAAP